MSTEPDPVARDMEAELVALRSERDRLRAEVEGLRTTGSRGGWWRRTSAAFVVALACIVLVASVVGLWARRNFLDNDRFVARAGPLIEEPAVQEALAARVTEQVATLVDPESLFEEALPERGRILAVPLANAVEGFVGEQVEAFLATERFEQLWVGIVGTAHEAAVRVLRGESEAVTTSDGRVTLNLLPVVDAVLARITDRSPEILGRQVDLPEVSVEDIPEAAIARIEDALGVELDDDFGQFTVYDDGTLSAAQDAVSLFDRLVVVLLPLGVLLAAVALWVSHRRRRTLLQLCAGLALGMVLIRRVSFRVQEEVAALPPRPAGRESAGLAAQSFLHPLTTFGAWVLGGAAVVAAVAVLTADYPWVVSLRRRVGALWGRAVATTTDRAHDDATVAWIADHHDALLAAGGILAVVVLWFADLSWFGLLVVLVLVGVYALAVHRIGGRPADPYGRSTPGTTPRG
jgi:hypothetical protein